MIMGILSRCSMGGVILLTPWKYKLPHPPRPPQPPLSVATACCVWVLCLLLTLDVSQNESVVKSFSRYDRKHQTFLQQQLRRRTKTRSNQPLPRKLRHHKGPTYALGTHN